MSKQTLTLMERIANVSPIGINNFVTIYELAILLMNYIV